jgi:hypothetical protein
MTRHFGILLDWTVADFAFLGIAIQQYISITRDLKRSREHSKQDQGALPRRAEGAPSARQPPPKAEP